MLLQAISSGSTWTEILIMMAYLVPALLIGFSFHEAAHAYAAFRAGDPTARNLGRMSLDPLRHLDPMGTLMLLLVGFGWAKPVPINPRNFRTPRRDEFVVSIAGILTNFVLAFFAMGLYVLLSTKGWYDRLGVILNFLIYLVQINVVLAVFNLIPLPPLDGHHLVTAVFPRTERFYYSIARYGFWILIGVLFILNQFNILETVVWSIINKFYAFYKLFM